MSEAANQEGKYHHLIAGQVMITVSQGDEVGMNAAFLNGVITTKEPVIGAHDLGRAQQTLQMLFMQKIPADQHKDLKIIDVVIMSISPMGYMTDERFHKKPDNVEIRERAKAALSLVASNDVMSTDPAADLLK